MVVNQITFSYPMQMKPVVESQSNAIIKQFTAIMYTSQVVNGINYVIKVSETLPNTETKYLCTSLKMNTKILY